MRISSLLVGCVTVVSLTVVHAAPASAQASIPTPAEYHGYDVGTQYTITSAIIGYYKALAEASPRVEYLEYGTSIQGRPLPMLIISSEANLARKEQIRGVTRQLTGADGEILTPAAAQQLTDGSPAIAWLMIVDTDEEAGVQALQEMAYELATMEDAGTRAIRDGVLVIMTPLTNPDSHARYVTWHGIYNVSGAATDPLSVENTPHWAMNTDGNAWGIDVNRDFGFFVTPEMRALARAAMHWRPQIWLDIHSGPNVIFLPPFPRPFHPLWSSTAPKWWEVNAQRANERFGEKGWSFSSRKDYEGVVGVGFGLSWAMLSPTVSGLLYETFGGRPGKTTEFIRSDGTLATMRMAMDRHKEGIYSLLDVTAARGSEMLQDAYHNVVQAMEEARANSVREVIIPAEGPGVDPSKVARLIDRLTLQDIIVQRTDEGFTAQAADFFDLLTPARRDFPAGTYVIDLVQPNARLARALLDPTLDFSDPQVEVPYDKSMPYYDAPWGNTPFLFGVQAYGVAVDLDVAGHRVDGGDRPPGRMETLARTAPPYGYLLPAGFESSYRVAVALMRDGYNVRVFTAGTRVRGEDFTKGSFGIIRRRNPEGLDEALASLSREFGARVVAVPGPYTDGGLTFGDDSRLAPIPHPSVAVVADWPVSQDHTFGGIRSTLEGDFGMPFSPVMVNTLNTADLSGYTAIVLPHAGMSVRGGPNFNRGYRGLLDPERLRDYVGGGGTLIAMQGAGAFLAEDPVLGAGLEVDGWAERTQAVLRGVFEMGPQPAQNIITWRPGLEELGFPLLAAGYPREEFAAPGAFPVLYNVPEDSNARVIARYGSDPARLVLDGFALDADRSILAGRPLVIVQPVGKGRVIYFAEDITFRGYWYGMNLLFMNALLFGPTQ